MCSRRCMCVCSANRTAQSTGRHTCTCIGYERMETIHRCGPNVVGLQAFESASAFSANIGAWNTASATCLSYVSAFSAVARKRSAVVRSVGL
jgi:hypothetical protein